MVSGTPVLIGRDVRCSGCPMSRISLGNVHWGSAAWAPPTIASTSNKAASLTAEPVRRFVIFPDSSLRRRARTTKVRRFGFIFGRKLKQRFADCVAGVLIGSSAIGHLADL